MVTFLDSRFTNLENNLWKLIESDTINFSTPFYVKDVRNYDEINIYFIYVFYHQNLVG
jgi:hypothetical protein